MRKHKNLVLVISLILAAAVVALADYDLRRAGGRVYIDKTGAIELHPAAGQNTTVAAGTSIAYSATNYSGTGSFQPVAPDLNLAAAAGSTNGKFLAAGMGNIFGNNLSKSGNYLFGFLGANSITGTRATELQVGGIGGIIMDGSTNADGAVVAIIDGSDPSSVTRANAAFAARMNNNNAASGVDYGVDLYDAGRSSGLYTGGGQPFKVAKADVRMTNEVCILNGAGAPSNGTTGAAFAGPGSLYIDTSNKKIYINTNTKASPTWTLVGSQT